MKAIFLDDNSSANTLIEGEFPIPQPGANEILVRVHAAGVTPTELVWYPTTHTKSGEPRHQAIPGHEFSGIVEALGEGTLTTFQIGQEIYGMSDWFAEGATAEFCLTEPASIALKPKNLSHTEAATVPIGALTAWQGLIERAKLQSGETVLIHGGAGAVGIFAVQLAKRAGAHVITTASARHTDFLKSIGAAQVIDYRNERFEDLVKQVDVIFDGVGGETLERSWGVLAPNGRLVTIAADSEGTTDERAKAAFFIVEPNQEQLTHITELLESGDLKTFVDAAVPLAQADAAYRGKVERLHGYGKVVITVAE